MILPNKRETEGGQKTYYKYMRFGDDKVPPSWTYQQLLQKSHSLLSMLSKFTSPASCTLIDKKEATTEDAVKGVNVSIVLCSDDEEWECSKCTLINERKYSTCQVCGQCKKRFSESAVTSTSGSKAKKPKIMNKNVNTKLKLITSMFRRVP